jgi:hypothetical protein
MDESVIAGPRIDPRLVSSLISELTKVIEVSGNRRLYSALNAIRFGAAKSTVILVSENILKNAKIPPKLRGNIEPIIARIKSMLVQLNNAVPKSNPKDPRRKSLMRVRRSSKRRSK